METLSVIEKAIEICGSRTALAHHLDLSTSSIDKWLTQGVVPGRHCIELSRLVGAPLHHINPDVFDPDVWILSDEEQRLILDLREAEE